MKCELLSIMKCYIKNQIPDTDGFHISAHNDEKTKDICEFFKKSNYAKQLQDINFLSWKYTDIQNNNRTLIFTSENSNNEIMGTEVLLGRKWIINNEIKNCYLTCDSFVRKENRKNGLFKHMLSFAKQSSIWSDKIKSDFIIGIPNKKSINSFIKKGAIKLFDLQLCYKIHLMKKNGNYSNIHIINEINIDLINFIKEQSKNYSFINNKNTEFMNYRYSTSPLAYKIFVIRQNNKITGYCIVRKIRQRGISLGCIMDIMVNQYDDNSIRELTDFINNWMIENKCILSISIKNTILLKNHYRIIPNVFIKNRFNFIILAKTLDMAMKINDKIFLCFGDFDIF